MKMSKHQYMPTIVYLLLFMTTISQPSSARVLGNPNQNQHQHHHHNYHKITFLMQDVLNVTQPSSKPATTKLPNQLPFSKPLGLFPPSGGIPLPQSNPTVPVSTTVLSTQTLNFPDAGLSFPAIATLQELELGKVPEINQELFQNHSYGSQMMGAAQGLYVASSEDGDSHMMALSTNFGNHDSQDGLRFFGVHRMDVPESHIAVIGGTGKYHGANGYAIVKGLDLGSNDEPDVDREVNKVLQFNVYLSYYNSGS